MTPDQVLEQASTVKFETIVVIGQCADGELFGMYSIIDYAKLIDLIKQFLMELDT